MALKSAVVGAPLLFASKKLWRYKSQRPVTEPPVAVIAALTVEVSLLVSASLVPAGSARETVSVSVPDALLGRVPVTVNVTTVPAERFIVSFNVGLEPERLPLAELKVGAA